MNSYISYLIAILAATTIAFFVFIIIRKKWYVNVPKGSVMIINKLGSSLSLSFTGALIYPVIYSQETMKTPLIAIEVARCGKSGLICADYIRADITVVFYVQVNNTPDDVLRVARLIGVDNASDKLAVGMLFEPKFSEAMKAIAYKASFIKLFENTECFRNELFHVIGTDLNGYTLKDIAVSSIDQTPKDKLDPSNILDVQGIEKINILLS